MSATIEERLQRVEDQLRIQQLIYRYAVGLDTKQWAMLDDVFMQDCVFEYGDAGMGTMHSLAEFVAARAKTLGPLITQHTMSSPTIEIDGDTDDELIGFAFNLFIGGLDTEYENPAIVDFDRKAKHVSFAYGPHLCVGVQLARREMRIAMEEFLKLIPEFGLREGYEPQYYLGMIQPTEVPLVWRPA